MKRLLLFAVFTITALTTSLAQVGIGTETPHGSAQLDVVASDKGVLLPRVALESTTDAITMAAGNENSILVFNTIEQNDVIPGFYYWYVDRWYKIANTADETITTIVANPDGTYSYFNEEGEEFIIDIPGAVADNFEFIYNAIVNEQIIINGDTYQSFEEYLTYIANQSVNIEGSDFINISGDGTQDDPYVVSLIGGANNTMLITNDEGELEWVDADTYIKANETVTTLVNNLDGTYTYTNEAGETTLIDIPADVVSNIVNEGDIYNEIISIIEAETDLFVHLGNGKYKHTTVDGEELEFDVNTVNVEKILDADGNVLAYEFQDADGNEIVTLDIVNDVVTNILNEGDIYNEIISIIEAETDLFVHLGNGKYKHTTVDGEELEFDVNTVNVEKILDVDGNVLAYEFQDADGNEIVTLDIVNDVVTNILNEGDIYNEIISIIEAETDIFVHLGNGKYKHTTVDGEELEFDVNTVNVEKILDADGNVLAYEFQDADGNEIVTLDIVNDVVTNILNEGDIYNEIISIIEAETDLFVHLGNGKYKHTTVDGEELEFDVNTVNVEKILDVDGNVLAYEFQDADGNEIVTLDIVNDVVTNILNEGDIYNEIISIIEAETDIFVHLGNGKYKHTTVDGEELEFDVNTVNVIPRYNSNGKQVGYDFLDADGDLITTIYTDAASSFYDNSISGLLAEDVQKAIDELVGMLEDGAGVTLVDNGDGTISLKSENGTDLGTVNKADLTDNNDGTYTFNNTGDPADDVIIDIPASIINQFHEIINSGPVVVNGDTYNTVEEYFQDLIEATETVTILVDNGDGTFTYTNENGDDVTFDANTTTFTDNNDGTFTFTNDNGDTLTIDTNADALNYDNTDSGLAAENVQDAIDELVGMLEDGAGVTLVDNGDGTVSLKSDNGDDLGTIDKAHLTDNNDGTYTFDNGDGTPVVIDIPASIVNQFHEIINSGPVTVNGDTYNTVEEYFQDLIETTETVTVLVDNGDGTFTYTNEDGDDVTFDANTTTFTDNNDGTYTFTNDNGDTMTIDTNADALNYDNTDSGLAAENVQDAIDELVGILEDGAGVELVDNGDGTITLKSDNGDDLGTIDKAHLTDNNDGTYTFDNGDGTPVVIDIPASIVNQFHEIINSGPVVVNGDTYTTVEEYFQDLIETTETVTVLVDNGDGTFTYTNENGDDVTFDANTTTFTDNNDGTFTFTNDNGDTMTIDTNADALNYNNTDSGLTADNVQDAIDELVGMLEDGAGVTLVDNGDGTVSLKSDNGDDLGTIDKAHLTDNNDGTYTFDNGDGTPVVIDIPASIVNQFHEIINSGPVTVNGDTYNTVEEYFQDLIEATETVTILVDNGDGTFTYTNEDGDDVTFDANTTTFTDNNDGTYTFTNDNGDTMTIDTNADALNYDNTDSGLAADNVQDAIDELVDMLEDGAGVTLVDNGDGTITLKSDNGDDLGTIDKAHLTDNNDGTYTFDNGDGTPVVIDVPASIVNQFDEIINSGPVVVNGDTYNTVEEYFQDLIEGTETVTILVDNGDGTFTYTNEDGDDVTFDANTTTFTDNNDGTFTFTNDNGDTLTIDTNADALNYDNTDSGLAAENVQDAIDELVGMLEDGAGVTLVDNGDGTVSLKSDNGDDLGTIDKAHLTDNNDGTYTFDNGDGTPVVIDVPASIVNQFDEIINSGPVVVNGDTYNTVEEYFQDLIEGTETVTILVDNGDGTFTYTNENGDDVTFDANTTTFTDNNDGTFTFTNDNGDTMTIDTNADAIAFDNTNNDFDSTNVQDALEELLGKITGVEGTKGELSADASIVVNNGEDALLKDADIKVATGGIKTEHLADDAVTEDKITDNAVTEDKIADDAVTEDKIEDGAVAPEKLSADPLDEGKVGVVQADGSVVYENLSSDNIDGKDLTAADGSIIVTDGTGATLVDANVKVADGGITTDKLADDAVTEDKIADDAVTEDKIEDGAVAPEKLSADPLDEGKVGVVQADGSVVYENLSSDNIDGKDLTAADGSIIVTDGTGATLVDANVKVADGGITTDKLADDAVTEDKIADDAVTEDKIEDGAVAPEKLSADPLDEGKVGVVQADGSVVYENLSSDNIDGKNLTAADNSITVTDGTGATLVDANVKVTEGGITTDKLADDAVTEDKLADDAVTEDKIADNAVTEDKLGAATDGSNENMIPVADANGNVTYQLIDADNIKTEDITLEEDVLEFLDGTDGEGAVLKEVAIGIKDGAITEAKLADDAVTEDKIADKAVTEDKLGAATDGSNEHMVPVAAADGSVTYKQLDVNNIDTKNLIPADFDSDPSLDESTIEVVTGGEDAVLVETSLRVKKESLTPEHLAKTDPNQALVTDKTGEPMWATQAPRFFYMPSVMFDTSTPGTYTRDLHAEYAKQFGGDEVYITGENNNTAIGPNPILYTGGIISSDTTEPVVPIIYGANELIYYVTYFDENVFEKASFQLTADGKLTYEVKAGADPHSYMNIVFYIK